MQIETTIDGRNAFMGSFSDNMIKCGLFNQNDQELTYIYYERQSIAWSLDASEGELTTQVVAGTDYAARFSVGAGTVKYVGFFNLDGDLLVKIDLEGDAVTYDSADAFDIVSITMNPVLELIIE